uniref:Glutamate racemase n=1 Tax=Cyanothece sp. (strain PCC 7425 / ATCC 29141) TaxID=395961 RepID=B8HMN9_CYAP4
MVSSYSDLAGLSLRPANQSLSQQASIGVFDSGVGGLTVLRVLQQHLPQESFLYFADTAHLPYGNRCQAEIVTFARQILTWMTEQGVKMVIVACNTSSALALDIVRTEFNLPILGLILPGARTAVQRGKRIGIIATAATVASECYPQAILEANPQLQVWQMSCPEFVPLIEQNRINDPYTLEVARTYLQPLIESRIDTLIYGCTHYPHLESVIRKVLPRSVQRIDPARSVVTAAARELELLGLRKQSRQTSSTRFFASGCPEQFARVSSQWLGYTPVVEHVELPLLSSPLSSSTLI